MKVLTIVTMVNIWVVFFYQLPKDAVVFKGQSLTEFKSDTIPRVDTQKTYTYDTTITANSFPKGNKNDSAIVKFFNPYFVNDICEPGNTKHHAYQKFSSDAKRSSNDALIKLSQNIQAGDVKTKKEIEASLKDINNLKNCRLEQLMVYYLTPNVVLYDMSSNIKRFYNLDTTSITYIILKGNKIIGIMNYKKGKSIFKPFYDFDSLSYYQVLFLKKKPIALKNDFKLSEINVSGRYMDCFGHISKENHLVLSQC
ncbi:MAG TPA: hypothetical protein VGQ04_11020 [Chitinophagaceae bacterium]|nr:hypothetical protein [Chitinophagaceae bacterium]